jgi:hypothetical protein
MISNRHRSVRKGFILFFTYLLLLAAAVFTIEMVFILFGVGDIFFPWVHKLFTAFHHIRH